MNINEWWIAFVVSFLVVLIAASYLQENEDE